MTIGNPRVFAIESSITRAYENPGLRALGLFVIHVGGRRFGVYETDATMLGSSFDAVSDRIRRRGQHTAPFASEPDGGKIAGAFRNAIYADKPDEMFFGIPLEGFANFFKSELNDIVWAPDGDEAFDDGSYVLQFDVDNRVRLIAFGCGEGYSPDHATLKDVWLPADDFYSLLQEWRDAFLSEWTRTSKMPNAEKATPT